MRVENHSSGRFYRPELDVVRFLAFFCVFLHHVVPDDGDPHVVKLLGHYAPILFASREAFRFGLNLFFTLSAFLICELLLRERQATGTVAVKEFYVRRILRIWPLYYLGLALGALVVYLPGGFHSDMAEIGWFSIFMSPWCLAHQGWHGNPVFPMWSISVEEQFYVFSPWVVKYLNRKMLYGFCVLLIAVANGRLYWLTSTGHTSHQSTFNSFVQFECFAAGILLCLALKGKTPGVVSWQRPILLATAWLCWFLATYPLHTRFDTSQNPGFWPLMSGYALASLGSVLILIAFLGMDAKWLPGWAIYLGRISFGLYVYHEFVIYAMHRLLVGRLAPLGSILPVKFAIDLGATIAVAALSYRYFETPFLRMKKRHSVIESQPIAGAR